MRNVNLPIGQFIDLIAVLAILALSCARGRWYIVTFVMLQSIVVRNAFKRIRMPTIAFRDVINVARMDSN